MTGGFKQRFLPRSWRFFSFPSHRQGFHRPLKTEIEASYSYTEEQGAEPEPLLGGVSKDAVTMVLDIWFTPPRLRFCLIYTNSSQKDCKFKEL